MTEIDKLRECMKLERKAHEVLKSGPYDTIVEFDCPLCCNKAIAKKSGYNGHVHCCCETCNIQILQ